MSPPQKIFVTGATGTQGGGVARHALRAGHSVYAFVRTPSSSTSQALAAAGATLVPGSFEDDAASLARVMRGMDALYLQPPGSGPRDVGYATRALAAARAASVPVVVCSTAARTGDHAAFPGWGPDYPMREYWLAKHAIEEAVRGAGLARWTLLRPAHFLQNLAPPVAPFVYSGFAETGVLKTAVRPGARLGWVDATDAGVVVAAVLEDPERYAGRAIELASESLTMEELAAQITEVTGRKVTVEPYSEEELEEMARKGSGVLGSQRWASEVKTDLGVETAAKEFRLTPVRDFLARTPLFTDA
ncbi:hypothetical protein SLS62_008403 [Diatrype stigma]|uniref:NmrA-like domain-containing protein n=1 Tax=Diatrype stigma TaxID=117547 RepID=A0AAN9ULC2_9PEZI